MDKPATHILAPEKPETGKPVRHVLGVSGGKDSAALALFMKDRVPQTEYFFSDTGYELAETLRIPGAAGGFSRQAHRAAKSRTGLRSLARYIRRISE